ncbi:MAG: hypothetical protein K0V04_38250 [Deltaproteobacteria bacterium]|nr:hypothetical protein [Deltaproteobacteria bacterium]
MTDEPLLREPPTATAEEWATCEQNGDFWPLAFEHYKYVAELCSFFSNIDRRSPALRDATPLEYSVLRGLLNRCARLMLATMHLSKDHLFGESTAILGRCIFESCLTIMWLCDKNSKESLTRYLAQGLKTEIEYKKHVAQAIARREGKHLPIEERMLASFQDLISSARLTEEEVTAAKKLPDVAAMMNDVELPRLAYVALQKMGSHHVHGTWPSLRGHYLQESESGELVPRDHDCPAGIDQLVTIAFLILRTLQAFTDRMIKPEDQTSLIPLLDEATTALGRIYTAQVGSDFAAPE